MKPAGIFFLLFAFAQGIFADEGIVISEVMFNPSGNENAREFVEILNLSSEPVSIEGYLIGDGTGFDELRTVAGDDWLIPPESYALIFDPDYFTADEPFENIPGDTPLFTVGDKALGSRGFSNSAAEPVYLISAEGDTVSAVRYSLDCPPGHSWERILPFGGDGIDNFAPSKNEHGTPGQPNSILPPPYNPSLDGSSFLFEPTDPQAGDDVDAGITFRNGGLETVSDVSVAVTVLPDYFTGILHFTGDVLSGERSSEASLTIENIPGGCLGIRASVVSEASNTFAGDDTVYSELYVPAPEKSLLFNEVMAAPNGGDPEWAELVNACEFPVDIYNWSIADRSGSVSNPVNTHCIVMPGEYAVLSGGIPDFAGSGIQAIVVERFPALNNDGDSVVIFDCTGTAVDSMVYDDAPPGNSLELISADMSGEMSGWDTCVDPSGSTPGKRNSIDFSVAPDQDEPEKKSVEITIDPNPFPETVSISYELPFPLARIRLLVYDRRGRLVATLRDVEESGSSWSGTWDGRLNGARLPAGPYILDFEALDKRTGKMYRERKTVVIASRL